MAEPRCIDSIRCHILSFVRGLLVKRFERVQNNRAVEFSMIQILGFPMGVSLHPGRTCGIERTLARGCFTS